MDDKGKFKTKIAAPKGKFKFGGTAIPSFMTHNQEAFPRPGDPLLKKGPMNLMPQNPHFAPEASGISEQSARDMLVQVMPLKRQASNNGEEIPGKIDFLFKRDGRITLSSIHRAKGSEAPRVTIIQRAGAEPWMDGPQEDNLDYVSRTRPMNVLQYYFPEV